MGQKKVARHLQYTYLVVDTPFPNNDSTIEHTFEGKKTAKNKIKILIGIFGW